jgi:hypothetical protein
VGVELEKKRSGVKTQRRREGTRSVEWEGGCTWKRRTFWFSMRWSRRAAIQYCGGKDVCGCVVEDLERAMHHFQMRWPAEAASGLPRMWAQWVQWRAVGVVWT